VYTHWHPDHSAGAFLFPKNAQYITSEIAAKELKKHNVAGRSLPGTTFETFVGGKIIPNATKTLKVEYTFMVDGNPIKLIEIKSPAHSEGDLIVLLPNEKVAMAVDLVTPGWIIWENWGYAHDLQGYYDALIQLKSLDFDKIVTGHLNATGTKKDVQNAIEYFDDVRNAVASAMQTTTFQEAGNKAGYENKYIVTETYFDIVAKKAADDVIKKWNGKIAGLDVWVYNHARHMITYLRYN
jgi:glyoxylase-like metal-dependent hydrolase (beta-lactamase superfamily II)